MAILCSNCRLNQDSMSIWLIHLVNCHPLPAEWLSDKAKLLTDDENRRPYTVVTDSRKRRRRPTTPRPLNTFMIFSRHIRRNILSVFPDASNSLVSKELGLLWKNISHDIKSCYEDEAKRLAQLHAQEFPDYKYQPKKRILHRTMYERQISPTNTSQTSAGTDEENIQDRNNRSPGDRENQYIRYSILGKSLVKECQTFISPLKNVQIKTEELVTNEKLPKPFNVRFTNFSDSNNFMKQSKVCPVNSLYIIPSPNLVSSSTTVLEHNVEEEIDITGNIFGNELDLEWSEYDDDDDRQDLPTFNTLFNH